MTSKTKQSLKKIPISIFFYEDQVPKNISFEKFSSYSIFKTNDKVLINLTKISKLNILQKNYKLLLIGHAIKIHCKSGDFFVDFFGCDQSNIKNFFLGWSLENYSFDKFKTKNKNKKKNAIIHHKFQKEINPHSLYLDSFLNE